MLAASIFNPFDMGIMLLYFGAIIWIGLYFSRTAQSTEGYFLGGHSVPSWALGLSMMAAKISSVTFLALPAAAFALDWRLFVPYLTYPVIGLVAIWIFIPFYRNGAKTTAFEYLNSRFGKGARLYGSLIFILGQILRVGSILYLLSIPVQMITGISPLLSMLLIGGMVTLYTVLGGIKAVIWTDVIQSFILYIGGVVAMVIILRQVPGGLTQIVQSGWAEGKFGLGSMQWNPSERTFWAMLIVGTTSCLHAYTADQNMVQRYLSSKTLGEARKAALLSTLLCLPTWGFFFFIGTALFVFYHVVPDPAIANLPADNVFPHFILTQMPVGLTGVVLAGILSASMGSLSSSLNSIATVSTVDVIAPYLLRGKTDQFYTRTAKAMTGFAAFAMLFVAFFYLNAEKESFVDLNLKIGGLIGGVTLAFFMLGFFAPKVNSKILWLAFWLSFAVNVYLVLVQCEYIPNFLHLNIHPYWVGTFVVVLMIVIAVVLSLFRKAEPQSVAGLTLFTLKEKKSEPVLPTES